MKTGWARHHHRDRVVWFGEEKGGWLWFVAKDRVEDGRKEDSES